MHEDLPLARFAALRLDERRRRPDLIAELAANDSTGLVVVRGDTVGLEPEPSSPTDAGEGPGLARLTAGHLRSSGLLDPPTVLVDLGRAGSVDYLGLLLDSSPSSATGDPALLAPKPVTETIGGRQVRWAGLRDVGADLTSLDAGLATAGIALAAWHARAGFCPACGASTEVTSAGWVRTCQAEGTELFPRTDPAVIMAVTDPADRLLLGNSAAWHSNRFSLIAGFVEAGESAEAAVRREVWEETRVEVGAVRYLASQPWPFPGSLMMAFEAEALTTSITVDTAELAQARWFTRAELAQAVENGEIQLAMRASIARAVIERWHGAAFPLP